MTRPTLLRRASSGLNSLPIRKTAATPALPSRLSATFRPSSKLTPEHRMEVIKASLLILQGIQELTRTRTLKQVTTTQRTHSIANHPQIPKTPSRRLLASDIFKNDVMPDPTSVEALPKEFHPEPFYSSQIPSPPTVVGSSKFSYYRPQAPEDLLGPLAKSPLNPNISSQPLISSKRRFQSPTQAFSPPSLLKQESSSFNYINPRHNPFIAQLTH